MAGPWCGLTFCLLILLAQSPFCAAWLDDGHMLVGGIAKYVMTHQMDGGKTAVEALEAVLRGWEYQYPGLSSLVTAPIWPDHIKCTKDVGHCRGGWRHEGLRVFDAWHSINVPLNPLDVALPENVHESINAQWLLEHANKTLMELGRKQDKGTIFSWNFMLRFLMHVYRDIHQPLHACTLYNSQFANGDKGGNDVKIKVAIGEGMGYSPPSLHTLWDAAGGPLQRLWPQHTEEDVLCEALEHKDHIRQAMASPEARILDFKDIIAESHQFCEQHVYTEFLKTDGALPYQPSDDYIHQTAAISYGRIIIAGVRLAQLLMPIADNAISMQARETPQKTPEPVEEPQNAADAETTALLGVDEDGAAMWKAMCGLLVLAVLCLSVMVAWLGWRQAWCVREARLKAEMLNIIQMAAARPDRNVGALQAIDR
ncbi:unnamed protein product [Vitrella brassicaformis CCMP3155]|uniref:Aspergillus nuclease S(1) n=2 Tax=Vitrella brassicaformis TaxID=1169539 RepID=A0A0G4FVG6_VITBC|nr:unnamed protein product [Vitrella brassicaformis CCMP3155]|eukprot:CEM18529.1 unnamed protein product [Vitrella brassicaformis CCMP3155]